MPQPERDSRTRRASEPSAVPRSQRDAVRLPGAFADHLDADALAALRDAFPEPDAGLVAVVSTRDFDPGPYLDGTCTCGRKPCPEHG